MLKIFFLFKSQYLKTAMEYTFNFWMMFFAGVVVRTMMLAIPYVLFRNMSSIAGWHEMEIYFIMALVFISEGFSNLFFDGVWEVPAMVFRGEFDAILSRPISPLYQVIARGFGLQGIGVMTTGILILIISMYTLNWLTPVKILICILLIACGAVLRMSINLISACHMFWLNAGPGSNVMFMTHSMGEYAKYPLDIYPMWLKVIMLTILPYGVIGFIPALIFRSSNVILLSLAMLAFTALFFMFARLIFYKSINKYESVGM